MHVTVGELIGNFILIAGSFILLIVLVKKFAWSNLTSIFEERAEKSKASILADAKLEAGRLKEKANQEIAQNKAEALQSVKGEVADLTVSLAGKIISQNLDGHAHKELIDQYIDQLGES